MVICLERGADLHVAQLMPLPLTVSCFSKIQIGFSFLVPAHPGSPGQRAVNRACYMCQYCIVRRARCVVLVGLAEIAGVRPRRVCTSNVVVLGGGGGASSPAVMPPLCSAPPGRTECRAGARLAGLPSLCRYCLAQSPMAVLLVYALV